MRRDEVSPRRGIPWLLALLGALAAGSACGNSDRSERAALLATPAAQHLVGTWAARFSVDAGSFRPGGIDSTTVAGTISLEEDTYGRVSTDELENATHAGVYDLDFSKLGFSARASGELPTAIARVSQGSRGKSQDSLTIVLSPGTTLFPVVMTGVTYGDSALGQWTATANRSGGISGRFVMKRLR